MPYLCEMDPETGLLSADLDPAKGQELAPAYRAAQPFPHVMIEDFLPRTVIDLCLAEFTAFNPERAPTFNRAQERLKTQFNPDSLSIRARTLFYGFNARPFLRTIENITGIEGLIPDPYFLGGGFHETTQGGHLSIHADFNHHKPMDLERRVNVLIYLNDDWDESYGGCLELWDRGMKSRVQSYVPTCNRCVIFSTTTDSYHGNPEPVNHPRLVSRKSIALYYYTSTWTEEKRGQTTQFRVRKGTDDRIDWTVKRNELIADLIPPVLARSVRRIRASRRRRD